MAGSFETPLDMARRACQHLGERMITSFSSTNSVASVEFNESYARLRDFELERSIWSFATRAVILRPVDTTTFIWTPPTYSAAATYTAGAIVAFTPVASDVRFPTAGARARYWQALQDLTAAQGGNPDVSVYWQSYCGPITGQPWASSVSYYTGEIVSSGGAYYMSLVSSNQDTPPSSKWLLISGTAATLKVFYPIGTGPSSETGSFNVMRLPYGFRRMAPRYLWNDDYPWLGADIANNFDDWVVEGDYIITRYTSAQMIRFVAGVVDVFSMHAMFCEVLAARMAYEGCERITGSVEKRKACLAAYEFFANQARLVNAILEGMPKQPQSEYITVRN